MDRKVFERGYRLLCGAFRQRYEKDQAEAYWHFLKNMPEEEFVVVIEKAAHGERFPNIDELKETPLVSEYEVAEDIMRTVDDYGSYQIPEFTHEISAHIISDLGWVSFCNMPMDEARTAIHFSYLTVTKSLQQARRNGTKLPPPKFSCRLSTVNPTGLEKLDVSKYKKLES